MIDKIKKTRVEEIGKNTWKDTRGGIYILDPKKEYFLRMDDRQAKIWQLLGMRYIIALLIVFIAVSYSDDYVFIGFGIAIVAFIVMELLYRFKFIPSLAQVARVTNPEDIKVERFARFKKQSRKEAIKGFGFSTLIAVLLAYNFTVLGYGMDTLTNVGDLKLFITVWAYILITVVLFALAILYLIKIITAKE